MNYQDHDKKIRGLCCKKKFDLRNSKIKLYAHLSKSSFIELKSAEQLWQNRLWSTVLSTVYIEALSSRRQQLAQKNLEGLKPLMNGSNE